MIRGQRLASLSLILLLAHGAVAALWWWLMPGGFALTHPRFWMNKALPAIVVVAAFVLCLEKWRFPSIRPLAVLFLAAAWMAAAAAARIVFPLTFHVLWFGPLISGLVIAVAGCIAFRAQLFWGIPAILGPVLMGTTIGAWLVVIERPEKASTEPMNMEMKIADRGTVPGSMGSLRLSRDVSVDPANGYFTVENGARSLWIVPLLTFQSRSADGCWTLFASGAAVGGTKRKLTHSMQLPNGWRFFYHDDDISSLDVRLDANGRFVEVEAISRLPKAIWSHLNSFTQITFAGRNNLSVLFSPCPDQRVDILPSDYPFGRPARFACIDRQDQFRVLEARNAEKGPFRQLAGGQLKKSDPLTLTLCDGGEAVFKVTSENWSAQASRQLSPCAGWNIPMNAIEFSLTQDSMADIFFALAATSVGRGYDSVGHRPVFIVIE